MVDKEIICLANSRKYKGKCVAGKDAKSHLWVRPVSRVGKGELKPHQIRFDDGNLPEILDIMRVSVEKSVPKSYQPENWQISSGKWVKIGTYPVNKLDDLCDDVPVLWVNDKPSKDRISHKYIEENALDSSLIFIKVKDVIIIREDKDYEDGEKKKVRVNFSYNQIRYTLSVTDPEIEKEYLGKSPGKYPVSANRIYMCISLGEPYEADDCCYKLVAAIIATDDIENTAETSIDNDKIISLKTMKPRNKESIMQAIIQTMENVDFKFGRSFLKDVLKGSKSKRILETKSLTALESYGLLSDYTGEQILAIIDELISDGYLVKKKNSMGMPVLGLTKAAKGVSIERRETPEGAGHLFDKLKNWRYTKAKEEGVPPFVVALDRSLQEIIDKNVTVEEELYHVFGFGKKRIEKYGSEIIKLLDEYYRENK